MLLEILVFVAISAHAGYSMDETDCMASTTGFGDCSTCCQTQVAKNIKECADNAGGEASVAYKNCMTEAFRINGSCRDKCRTRENQYLQKGGKLGPRTSSGAGPSAADLSLGGPPADARPETVLRTKKRPPPRKQPKAGAEEPTIPSQQKPPQKP